MLRTVKAEVDESGTVHLLEPLRVTKRTQAIITLIEEDSNISLIEDDSLNVSILQFEYSQSKTNGNAHRLQDLIKSSEFKNRKSYSVEEIEAQIEENRNSWD